MCLGRNGLTLDLDLARSSTQCAATWVSMGRIDRILNLGFHVK